MSELAAGPRALAELRPALGSPPLTTTRGYLRWFAAAAVAEKRRHGGFPGAFDYRLTPAGRDLVEVGETLAAWLAASPSGRLSLGSATAKGAIRALCEAWGSGIVHALAPAPLSLAELDSTIAGLSYPALKRRLASMRRLGLVRAEPGSQEGRPFVIGDWLRLAVAPLLSAARWERRWSPRPTPIAGQDVETWFLLALPALRLPERISGTCRLTVRMSDDALAGVTAEVREDTVISCVPELADAPVARVDGSLDAWLAAILGHDPAGLEFAGDTGLAIDLVDEMRRYLRLP